jgi:glycosyltransferase involved in cell wall biosynthesis
MKANVSTTLLHVFPSFAIGGSQMRFAALANHFGRRFRHAIVATDGRTECRKNLNEDLDIDMPEILLRRRDTVGNVRRFRSLLRNLRPSRLVTYNWGSIECAMANWPGLTDHIHIEDGFGPEEAERQLTRRVLTRRFVLARSTVVLPSRTLHRLAAESWKLDPAHLRRVPNGIDCARFGAPGITPFDWPGEGPIIGTVAALRPEKNVMRLVEALHKVRSRTLCRLLIAGDGPERAALEERVSVLGLKDAVRFTGQITETEQVYAALRVFALSSDTEQMPVTVLEAMAAGLPVAATQVGDVAQMVAAENRSFLTPRDASALAGAILRLIENPAAAASIGAANRAVVRDTYNQEKMFAAYEGLFCGMAAA